jgi:polyferredoxin
MSYRLSPKAVLRLPQWFFFLASLAIGVQFARFCLAVTAGAAETVSRPAGVEGFLPISALLGLRRLVATGSFDPVHPAGLWILLAAMAMGLAFRKGFCGHVCPVGFVTTRLGRFGQRLALARSLPSRLDAVLGLPKYLLLGFFLFTTVFGLDLAGVEAFLRSPYNITADARMLLFFAHPSLTATIVLTILALLGLVYRGSFCRWLCPYGALLGLLARLGPTSLSRDAKGCTTCGRCRIACPMDLPITAGPRPMACTGCGSCVTACPRREPAIRFAFAGRPAPWWTTAAGSVGLFALAYLAAKTLGLWSSALPPAMLARLYALALGG